jgi:Carbohydrate binding module (family 6)
VNISKALGVCLIGFCAAARTTVAGTLSVNAGDDLQAALNAAQPGDTILLQPGATFTGNFVLPAKGGSSYITIRSAADDSLLPGPGARLTPAFAGQLPKIQADRGPALATATGATYWRLQFLELLPAPGSLTANLLELGNTGGAQSAMSMVAAHLVVDRCYIHGDAVQGQRRGIALNSAHTQVVNSYFSDFKGVQQDTQAVAGWNGPGPLLIENNYIEAAGENIMFGGGDPSIYGLVPGDITIRRNLITKPMEWRSQAWTVKNLIELKNAERVLIDGNVIENNWAAGQSGAAVLMSPRNQEGTAPWSAVRHIVVQNNVIRHVGSGFNIAGYDDNNVSQQTEDILIRNNLMYDVSAAYGAPDNPAPAMFAMIGAGPKTVRLDHNTVNNDGGSTIVLYGGYSPTGPLMWGFAFTNNLLRHNTYGLFGDATSSGIVALAAYAPDARVVRNTFADGPQGQYPSGNDFPSLWQWLQDFGDVGGQDYRLRSSSTSKSSGTDGKDLGVDFVELAAAHSNDGTATAPLPAAPSPAPSPSDPPSASASAPSAPHNGVAASLPGLIEAENFDDGGEAAAYHDSGLTNDGGQYRSEDVDIQTTIDQGGGYNVGWLTAGEWLAYSVNVQQSGTYAFDFRVAAAGPGGTFHVEANGVNITGPVTIPDTGGWQNWRTITANGVALSGGPQRFIAVMDTNGPTGVFGNINWINAR